MTASTWQTVPLVSVLTAEGGMRRGPWGGALKKEIFVRAGYPVYEQGHVIRGDFSKFRYHISDEKFAELSAFDVAPGDILMTGAGTIGTLAVVPNTASPGVFNQALLRFRTDKSKVDQDYFLRVLGRLIADPTAKLTHGSALKNLMSVGVLKEIPFPLPPLPEQRRIAAILDKADAIQRKRQEAIRLTEELLRSAFLEMFGDPVTNPKGWEPKKLGDLLSGPPNNGIFRKNHEYSDTGLPVVWVAELFKGHSLDTSKSRRLVPTDNDSERYGLRHGDILFCRSSLKLEGIGYNNVYLGESGKALFECHVIRVSPNQEQCNSLFLNYLLRTSGMRRRVIARAKTVTMSTLGQEDILVISLPVPPLSLQRQFADLLARVSSDLTRQRRAVATAGTLSESLTQRAFSGRL